MSLLLCVARSHAAIHTPWWLLMVGRNYMAIEVAQAEKKHVEIYTDGACEPNPGPGGYGVVLLYGQVRREVRGGFRMTTNNRMEIYAAIAGLEQLKKPCRVTLYSDSRYLVDTIMNGWAAKWKGNNWWRTSKERAVNVDLWERLLALCEMHEVEFEWVKGHAGNVENERCDLLSDSAIAEHGLPADEGYENRPAAGVESPKITKEGQACRKCSTPVIKQTPRRKAKRAYYYEYYLYCPKCRTQYMVEEAKRTVAQEQPLF